MRIGELAKRTGISVRSLRYYDNMGLLDVERKANGYREFDASAIHRAKKIRGLLENGFTVEDIRPLVPCLDIHDQSGTEGICEEVITLYQDKLDYIDSRICELQEVRARIAARLGRMKEHQRRDFGR